jgi:hypothetical protein
MKKENKELNEEVNLFEEREQLLKMTSDPLERIKIEHEFRVKVAARQKILGDQWKRGVYCTKCNKPFFTKRYWLLWLWTFKHLFICHSFNVSPTSICLINHDHEKIVNGRVKWAD